MTSEQTTQPRLMKTKELAKALGLHRNTIDHLRRTKQIPYLKMGGTFLYDLATVISKTTRCL